MTGWHCCLVLDNQEKKSHGNQLIGQKHACAMNHEKPSPQKNSGMSGLSRALNLWFPLGRLDRKHSLCGTRTRPKDNRYWHWLWFICQPRLKPENAIKLCCQRHGHKAKLPKPMDAGPITYTQPPLLRHSLPMLLLLFIDIPMLNCLSILSQHVFSSKWLQENCILYMWAWQKRRETIHFAYKPDSHHWAIGKCILLVLRVRVWHFYQFTFLISNNI